MGWSDVRTNFVDDFADRKGSFVNKYPSPREGGGALDWTICQLAEHKVFELFNKD